MIENIKNFLKDEEGATMVEYGLMVALIAVVCIAAVTALGLGVSGVFQQIVAALSMNLVQLIKARRGAILPEYALLVMLIAIVCVAAVTIAGTTVESLFASVPPGL